MLTRVGKAGRWAAAGLALVMASAAWGGISPVIFRIDASNAGGAAFYEATSDQLVPDPGIGGYKWVLPGQVELSSDALNVIALLNSATLRVVDNRLGFPRIILNFDLQAGAQDILVSVKSPLVSFLPLPAALAAGRASCGYTLTDFNDGVPAVLAGLDPPNGLGMFTAKYNGFVPGGTTFANLIAELAVDQGGSVSVNDAEPDMGFASIGTQVHSISVMHQFTLTAMDLMSGQNTFVVMPEPAGAAVLALAATGLLIGRRR